MSDKKAAIRLMIYFDPFKTMWTSMADFEHWFGKHLAENNMEAERVNVLGSPELVIVVRDKPQVNVAPPKQHDINTQFKNLKVK